MKISNMHDVILGPVITEKATDVKANHNQIVFKVRLDANKEAVKKAVEKIFKVTVENVRTVLVKGKPKRLGWRSQGRRSDWKKAIVTLKKGDAIEVMDIV